MLLLLLLLLLLPDIGVRNKKSGGFRVSVTHLFLLSLTEIAVVPETLRSFEGFPATPTLIISLPLNEPVRRVGKERVD